MARVKLSNRKGWVRLKPASVDDFPKGEEFVIKYNNQYLVAKVPVWASTTIVAKYKRDLMLSPKEVEVYKII